MQVKRNSIEPGIEAKHRAACIANDGGQCNCKPFYLATVYSAREDRRIRKQFESLGEARLWRAGAYKDVRLGKLRAPSKTTINVAAAEWLMGARSGAILTRSGGRYKPSALRSYAEALRLRILPEFGRVKLTELQTADLYRFAERLRATGLDGSTIRNTFLPLRAVYSRAVQLGEVAVNPTSGLRLPTGKGTRERVAAPAEAAALIGALPIADRALWATALYAGLRRGELKALDWESVDLANGVIYVTHGWDREAGLIDPKSRAGHRKVPIPTALREHLIEHKVQHLAERGSDRGLVFGRTAEVPFQETSLVNRAKRAWGWRLAPNPTPGAKPRKIWVKRCDDALNPIGLHECRHTYASLMAAAGVSPKELQEFMGHADISTTLTRYGHLFPGSEAKAAAALDALLEQTQSGWAPSLV